MVRTSILAPACKLLGDHRIRFKRSWIAARRAVPVQHSRTGVLTQITRQGIWHHSWLLCGALGIFTYVGAEVTIGGLLGARVSRRGSSRVCRSLDPAPLIPYSRGACPPLLIFQAFKLGSPTQVVILKVGPVLADTRINAAVNATLEFSYAERSLRKTPLDASAALRRWYDLPSRWNEFDTRSPSFSARGFFQDGQLADCES